MSGNETTVRRFMAALNSSGSLDDLNELCSAEVAQGWQAVMGEFSFSEVTFTIDDLVADGDKVAALWTSMGVHARPFLNIPASGKETPSKGSAFFTFDGGTIVNVVTYYDVEAILQHLGGTIQPA